MKNRPDQNSRFFAVATLEDEADHAYVFTGKVEIDVTDFLSLPAPEVLALMRDFDRQKAPYLSRLPGPDAAALDAAHTGRNTVTVSFLDFLDELGVVPDDADGEAWVNEEMLEKARAEAGYTPAVLSEGAARLFKIGKRWRALRYDGAAWSSAGTFSDERSANAALEKARTRL